MTMCVLLLLLLLLFFCFMGSNGTKQGDFGIFSHCIAKNSSVRLECYYANCPGSPSFACTFMANGVVLYKATDDMCRMFFPDQSVQPANGTVSYNCTLVRRKRVEKKHLTVNPSQRTGKKRIKPCPDTTGLHLHQAPPSLWPVVTLSLWRVLVTDSQAT